MLDFPKGFSLDSCHVKILADWKQRPGEEDGGYSAALMVSYGTITLGRWDFLLEDSTTTDDVVEKVFRLLRADYMFPMKTLQLKQGVGVF